MSKNQEIAERVLAAVGGEKNVNSVVHCATRLRFKLKDEAKADTDKLNADDDVIQVVKSGGQYQVVIGSHVSDVYKELLAHSSLGNESDDDTEEKGGNIFNRLIDIISSIFTPFLGAMAGIGILKGFLILATNLGLMTADSGAYQILYAASDGFMQFLPLALAFTAAKKFKTNQYISLAIAAAMVYPAITTAAAQGGLDFFGIPVIINPSGYMSTVIPIILVVWVQSYLERFVKDVVPQVVQIVLVPLLTVLVMVPLAFVVIGPLGTIIGNGLGSLYSSIYNFSPLIAGAVMGGLWQVFVMFGMHWGFVPIMTNNLALMNYDTMIPMLFAPVIAQAGASLAVFFKSKNEKRKALAISSTITSLFGITEPSVYGITLPLKKPFIAACISGAVGGAITGLFHVKAFGNIMPSILAIPSMISNIDGVESNVVMGIVAIGVAFVLSFGLTLILGFDEEVAAPAPTAKKENTTGAKNDKIILASPLTGSVLPLNKVEDQVFSSGALGKGVAIEPTAGKLCAPADGTVTTLFPTGHAVGITTTDGAEVLMHIGMDTVEMDGEGFEIAVKQGDTIKQGDLLVTFDIEKIKQAGYSTVTPIVVTNTNDYLDVLDMNQEEVLQGEDFLTVVR
jgi:PTS system beta-glucosides-specific IIC component